MALITLIQTYPRISIIIFSVLVSLAITLVNKLLINQERMKELKLKQKACQDEMKKCKDDPQKMMEMQKEMMSHMGETMKSSMLPMIITLIPLLIFFGWLRSVFNAEIIPGQVVLPHWIWWYIGASLVSSLVWRKVLKMA